MQIYSKPKISFIILQLFLHSYKDFLWHADKVIQRLLTNLGMTNLYYYIFCIKNVITVVIMVLEYNKDSIRYTVSITDFIFLSSYKFCIIQIEYSYSLNWKHKRVYIFCFALHEFIIFRVFQSTYLSSRRGRTSNTHVGSLNIKIKDE